MERLILQIKNSNFGIDFKIENFYELNQETISKIKEFVSKRNGYFNQNLSQFGLKKKLTKEQIIQYLEPLNMTIMLIKNECNNKDRPENTIIGFGKYKGKSWKDVPMEYLQWLYKKTENPFAYTEIKRRENIPFNIEQEVINFGQYKGLKWINLPVDYLEWIIKTFDNANEKYKIAKLVLEMHNKSLRL